MPEPQHAIIKPEKLLTYIVPRTLDDLVLPRLMRRTSLDGYQGARGDSVTLKVPGRLPVRDYDFRNENRDEIQFDTLTENTIVLTLSGMLYQATRLTDEQRDWDKIRWAELMDTQAQAMAAGMNYRAEQFVKNAPYAVTIGNVEQNPRGAMLEARRVLNKFGNPTERFLIVGSQFLNTLLTDEFITQADRTGDSIAETALAAATIGRISGFTVVESNALAEDEAIAMTRDAFIQATATPSVPMGAVAGGTYSADGIGMRWLQDYAHKTFTDQGSMSTYYGYQLVRDHLIDYSVTQVPGAGIETITPNQHFVRAIKLKLDGASDYPDAAGELAQATGIGSTQVWTPGTNGTKGVLVDEADATNV